MVVLTVYLLLFIVEMKIELRQTFKIKFLHCELHCTFKKFED